MDMVLNSELFSLLKKNQVLKLKGYSLDFDQEGGIVIDRAGHVPHIERPESFLRALRATIDSPPNRSAA